MHLGRHQTCCLLRDDDFDRRDAVMSTVLGMPCVPQVGSNVNDDAEHTAAADVREPYQAIERSGQLRGTCVMLDMPHLPGRMKVHRYLRNSASHMTPSISFS